MSEDRIARDIRQLIDDDAYDQDVALAILRQSRGPNRLSDIQVGHLIAIGYRSGYRDGLTDARPIQPARKPSWWRRLTTPSRPAPDTERHAQ